MFVVCCLAYLLKKTKIFYFQDFIPVELCNLEYNPERGSAIVPHLDDVWLWGERLVTLNVLSETVLVFSPLVQSIKNEEIAVVMPRRSLLVVSGSARYKFNHAIHREDIHDLRIAMTFRELTEEFLTGGQREEDGDKLITIANTFSGSVVR